MFSLVNLITFQITSFLKVKQAFAIKSKDFFSIVFDRLNGELVSFSSRYMEYRLIEKARVCKCY